MSEDLTPAGHAAAIDAARQRLIEFVQGCPDDQWESAPIEGDPRPVSVITDHVAHSYEYLGGWLSELLAGGSPEVTTDLVDSLNASHADESSGLTQAAVADHLKTSGDALLSMVGGLDPAQLAWGDGQVARFLMVATRHPDSHRQEITEALS
jgi:DinB family protein